MSFLAEVDEWLLDDQFADFVRQVAEPVDSLVHPEGHAPQCQDIGDLLFSHNKRVSQQALQEDVSDETQVSAHQLSSDKLEHARYLNRRAQKRFREKRKVP